MRNDQNTITTNKNQIEDIITSYYSTLFTTQSPSPGDIQNITEHITISVTIDMNDKLSRPFSGEEIRKALFD